MRLLQRFEDGEGNLTPFVLLHAPAGSGKSTLAKQLIESPIVERFQVHSTGVIDAQDQSIWHLIGRSITAEEPAPSAGKVAYTREWLHARIGALSEPTLLVIDDYHEITSVEHDRALLELSQINSHLHVCVLARSVIVLDGPLYTHRVRVINREDLAFNADECRELASLSGTEFSQSLSEALSQAHGWPVAVTAVLRATPATENPALLDDAHIQPILQRVAVDILNVLRQVDGTARVILLAASLVDTFSLKQAAALTGEPEADTRSHIQTLLQLGVFTLSTSIHEDTFRVHPAVSATLPVIAAREFSTSERQGVVRRAARESEKTAPLDAFRAYLRASFLAEAERVLWANFTVITDRSEACLAVLAPLTDAELFAHPILAAARLFLEVELPTVSPKRLRHTLQLSVKGAQRRLELNPDPTDPLYIGHRLQVMVGERMHGNAPAALAIAQDIEAQLTSHTQLADPELSTPLYDGPGTQPVLLMEIAFTAFMGGDSALARRTWQRLDFLMARKPGRLSPGRAAEISHATLRHAQWQHGALSGLALLETNDGDFRLGAQLLAQADQLRAEHGPAPALAWILAEVVRAHHSYEYRRPEMLRQAVERISPWRDRTEQWPMILMAEAENVRYQRGVDWALSHLRSGIAEIERERHGVGVWGGYLTLYQAMLHTTSGNLTASRQIMDSLPAKNSYVRIGRARRALFQGNNVQALLISQSLGSAVVNMRQQIDLLLIGAVAAWGCGRSQEAFIALGNAGELIERFDLSMMLRCVPFEPLVTIAAAARDAGICDVTALIDSVPKPARCIFRESLTVMEQRALETMLTHPPLADAALALGIAPATVKRHRLAVYRKLKVGSRSEAILQATRMGLLTGQGDTGQSGE